MFSNILNVYCSLKTWDQEKQPSFNDFDFDPEVVDTIILGHVAIHLQGSQLQKLEPQFEPQP
jgi:hypothetical protein